MDGIVPTPGDAVVSCHVEAPLDDRVWRLFSELQETRPGGFPIAALMRPPHEGENGQRWVARAREAAARGPLGHHTHFGRPDHGWPIEPEDARRVEREAAWLDSEGIRPTLFCGGAWYIDPAVAELAAARGYADCTALAFRPRYLREGRTYLHVERPTWLRLPSGGRLFELPSTHSLGLLARAFVRRLSSPIVHVYFHDTDLVDPRRGPLLSLSLRLLARRRRVTDLDALRAQSAVAAPEVGYHDVVRA